MTKRMDEMDEVIGRMKSKAFQILDEANFEEIYRKINIDDSKAVDAAVKLILADKLVESISKAKTYAKENNKKRLSASTIFIAAQEKG